MLLDAADGKMLVKSGRSRFSLPTLPRDDFPVIAEGELPTSFELPAAELVNLIDKDAVCHFDRRNALLSQWHFSCTSAEGRRAVRY